MNNLIRNVLIIFIAILAGVLTVNYAHKKSNSSTVKMVTLYFVKDISPNKQIVSPVTRKVNSSKPKIETALSELLKGPTQNDKIQGYYTEIPEETVILSLKQNKNSYTVNLSKDFESGGGSESMSKRVEQLEMTVLQNADRKAVYIEINGKQVQYIGGEGVEVTQPLSKESKRL